MSPVASGSQHFRRVVGRTPPNRSLRSEPLPVRSASVASARAAANARSNLPRVSSSSLRSQLIERDSLAPRFAEKTGQARRGRIRHSPTSASIAFDRSCFIRRRRRQSRQPDQQTAAAWRYSSRAHPDAASMFGEHRAAATARRNQHRIDFPSSAGILRRLRQRHRRQQAR